MLDGIGVVPSRQLPRATYIINVESEAMLPVSSVPKWLEQRKMGRPHVAVPRRWMRVGVRGIVLPSVLVGGRRFTSEQALRWWFEAAARCVDGGEAVPAQAEQSVALVGEGLAGTTGVQATTACANADTGSRLAYKGGGS